MQLDQEVSKKNGTQRSVQLIEFQAVVLALDALANNLLNLKLLQTLWLLPMIWASDTANGSNKSSYLRLLTIG